MVEQITAIFCDIDDFCIEYERYCRTHLLMDESQIVPKTSMSMSEIMTITVMFHFSNYRTFKWYYQKYVSVHLRDCFPKLVSYTRFVEIMQMVVAPLTLYLMKYSFGKCFVSAEGRYKFFGLNNA